MIYKVIVEQINLSKMKYQTICVIVIAFFVANGHFAYAANEGNPRIKLQYSTVIFSIQYVLYVNKFDVVLPNSLLSILEYFSIAPITNNSSC